MDQESVGVIRPSRFPGAIRLRGLLPGPLALLLLLTPTFLPAQVIPDTTGAVPDSVRIMTPDDTLEGEEPQADTINPQDTLPAVQPPALRPPVPAGWETGIWEWDREGILASRAVSLVELLGEIPGMVLLRGGDYGMPATVSAFGAGGGRIRVFRDGIELLPLEGSTPDLSRVGLGGLRSVRVVRSVTGIRVELESVLAEGGRPYSLVEAGTGDLNSNLFRGTFSHPRAFGGVFVFSMQRLDTRGPRGQEPGVGQGAWVRYARPLPWDGAFIAEYGSRSSDRGEFYSPGKASRSDWSARARWTLLPGLVGDLSYASSSINTEKPDTFDFEPGSRTQLSAILGYESEWIAGLARLRKLSGEGIPGSSAHLEARGILGRFGGVSAETTWESWDGESVRRDRLRAWTAPFLGLSLFYERGSGDWGLPFLPGVSPEVPDQEDGAPDDPQDDPPPETFPALVPGPRFSGQEGSRFGARFEWKGLSLAGALLETSADSLFLLGLPTDRGG